MGGSQPGKRLAAGLMLMLGGAIVLALTLPAMALFGWNALYLIFPGFAMVAVGLVLLLMAARARRHASR